MADVGEIIYYIKSLKKGFDKDLFQSKIDELAYAVNNNGLPYEDFHTLFKVWLNLSIPITRWVSLGSCLVPQDTVEDITVDYALRWILANLYSQSNHSRIGHLLDWLTVAMESEAIDMVALDVGYEIFYTILTYETLTGHALKLVYTLTKPADVTRRRVLELLEYTKIREGKRSMFRQLQVLLGLFKSYKPECVPEDVPAISIHTAFKKLNPQLLERFKKNQELRNRLSDKTRPLRWNNPFNSDRSKNKKVDPLVPIIQFNDVQRTGKEPAKTMLDFSDPVSLMQYSLQHMCSRPARLRGMLCNDTGIMLLTVLSHQKQAFLSHDLHHLLHSCFLDVSPHSWSEKQFLLSRLALLQRTAAQGLPVITAFLALFLPLWSEDRYFSEILELVEWVSVSCPEHIHCIVDSLSKVYRRAQPMEQCAILRSLTTMYNNLIYASTKTRYHFQRSTPSQAAYTQIIPEVAAKLVDLCNTELQVNPEELRVLYSAVWNTRRRAFAELRHGRDVGSVPAPLTLALPIISVSAALVDNMAELLMLYKKILITDKDKNESQILILSGYMADMLNCLYSEEAISGRGNGLIFSKIDQQLADKLASIMPDVDSKLSLRNHVAFAPYTYIQLGMDDKDANNKMWYNAVIKQEFRNLGRFLRSALPQLC